MKYLFYLALFCAAALGQNVTGPNKSNANDGPTIDQTKCSIVEMDKAQSVLARSQIVDSCLAVVDTIARRLPYKEDDITCGDIDKAIEGAKNVLADWYTSDKARSEALSYFLTARLHRLDEMKCNRNIQFNPARYIRIWEDRGKRGGRLLQYDPTSGADSIIMRVDQDSDIITEIDDSLVSQDLPLNQLFMSGQLYGADGSAKTKIQVLGYSEIGQDQATEASQAGVQLQTASNVKAIMENLYFTTSNLIGSICPIAKAEKMEKTKISLFSSTNCENETSPSERNLIDRYTLFSPEIQAMANYFQQGSQTGVAAIIGNEVFGVDMDSLKAIVQQYVKDLNVVLVAKVPKDDNTNLDDTTASALKRLRSRTILIYSDLGEIRTGIRHTCELKHLQENLPNNSEDCQLDNQALIDNYFEEQWKRFVVPRFKSLLVPGIIKLAANGVKDGDTVHLTVTALGPGGKGFGVPTEFQFHIKIYHATTATDPTTLFLHRQNVTLKDRDNGIARINFAPSPGLTYGVTFFNRRTVMEALSNGVKVRRPSDSPATRILSALAPGVGINVSFMSFDSTSVTYNAATSKFNTNNGAAVKVGAGPAIFLFHDTVHITYGWDLQTPQKRQYIGIGFGFVDLAKQLTSHIGK